MQSPVVKQQQQSTPTPNVMLPSQMMPMQGSQGGLPPSMGRVPVLTGSATDVPDVAAAQARPAAAAAASSAVPLSPALPSASNSATPHPALNSKSTRVTLVSPSAITPLTEQEVVDVKRWLERDKEYDRLLLGMRERMTEELRVMRAQAGTNWWEVGDGMVGKRSKFSVSYPGQRARETRKRGRREGFKLCVLPSFASFHRTPCDRAGVLRALVIGPRADCRVVTWRCCFCARFSFFSFLLTLLLLRRPSHIRPDVANRPEQLVPIRLEFDVEHHKMRDTFVWNLNGGRRFLDNC